MSHVSCLKRGTFTLEYAVLVAIVAATMLGMGIAMKRALEDRWRDVGEQFGQGRQYEPGVTVELGQTLVTRQ